VTRGLAVTGGVITSAGVVLAATFAGRSTDASGRSRRGSAFALVPGADW
jgi:hypothetical protein